MKTDRFKKRRLDLRRVGLCTHCGKEKAKPGCSWCPTCIAISEAKRQTTQVSIDARHRRRARLARKVELLKTSIRRLESRAVIL